MVFICMQSSEHSERYESNLKQLQNIFAALLRSYCIFNFIWTYVFLLLYKLHCILFLPHLLNVARLLCSVYCLCSHINVTFLIRRSCPNLCPLAYVNNGEIDHNHTAECFRSCTAATTRSVPLLGGLTLLRLDLLQMCGWITVCHLIRQACVMRPTLHLDRYL